MAFKDGWQLLGVNGEFDSTPVALKLFNVIDAAVDATKSLGLARIGTTGKAGVPENQFFIDGRYTDQTQTGRFAIFEVRRERFIAPGFYRINKPWEIGCAPENGTGFLAKLGLRIVEDVTVVPAQPVSLSAR
ncbi:MAG: hypothetical protein ACFCD0_25075 [Gemmataceae bacterium]